MTSGRFHMAVAAGVAVVIGLFGAAPAAAGLVPGGGSAKSDCYAAIDVEGVESGNVQKGKKITCTDGDPCDTGACGDGSCTLKVAVCINQSGLPGCTPPTGLQQLKVKGKLNVLIPQRLEGAVCTSPVDFAIQTKKKGKKPGKATFNVLAKAPKGTRPSKDTDSYQVICAPRTTDCPTRPPVQTVVTHPGGTISAAETWSAATHVLEGSISLKSTLTVAACSVIKMPIGGRISVSDGGALKLLGAPDCPITITSGKSVGSPGDWDYLEFYNTSVGPENILRYTILEYGGDTSYGALWIQNGASVEISNSTFKDLRTAGIYGEDDAELRDFVGNTFTNILGVPIDVGVTVAGDLQPATFTGNQEQAVALRGGTVEENATWRNLGVPYVVDSFSIQRSTGSATLTVEAGTTLKMKPATSISVRTNGALNLAGTAAAPVTVTSSRPGPAPGDWTEIDVYADSIGANNAMTYAVLEYGGGADYGLVWVQDRASVAISNSTFRYSGDVGINVAGGDAKLPAFTGNTLINNDLGPISLPASVVADLGPGVYTPNGLEGIIVTGGTVSRNAAWNDLGVRYLVKSNFAVNGAAGTAALTVNEGVTIALDQGRSISVLANGRLDLVGTSGNRVTVTSGKAVPTAGDWTEIDIYSAGNTWRYADISYGSPSASAYGQVWIGSSGGLAVDNVVFSNSGNGCDVFVSSTGTFTPASSIATTCN